MEKITLKNKVLIGSLIAVTAVMTCLVVVLCISINMISAPEYGSLPYRILYNADSSAQGIRSAMDNGEYDIVILSPEQTRELGSDAIEYVSDKRLLVFEGMTGYQVKEATGCELGFEAEADEKASSGERHVAFALLTEEGVEGYNCINLGTGFSPVDLVSRLCRDNVAEQAADFWTSYLERKGIQNELRP